LFIKIFLSVFSSGLSFMYGIINELNARLVKYVKNFCMQGVGQANCLYSKKIQHSCWCGGHASLRRSLSEKTTQVPQTQQAQGWFATIRILVFKACG
jgi:hypothetical protein